MNKRTMYPSLMVVFLLFAACNKKEVKLPLIDVDNTTEIQNHSSIWVFYGSDKGADQPHLNKNNKITNTHWIFNIDRRLKMGALIPVLEQMQEERNRDSMHKKEGFLNYFSYANTLSSNISLCRFDQTEFQATTPDLTMIKESESTFCVFQLMLDNEDWFLDRQRVADKNLLSVARQAACDSVKPLLMVLKYDEELSYENYLTAKAFLEQLDISTYSTEYVSN